MYEEKKGKNLLKLVALVGTVLLGLIGLIGLGGNQKNTAFEAAGLERVGPVTVDALSSIPYLVPEDATMKHEDLLNGSYLQGVGEKINFKKVHVNGNSTRLADYVKTTKVVDSGNAYIAAVYHHNFGPGNIGSGSMLTSELKKVDLNGNVLKTVWPATGKSQETLDGNGDIDGKTHNVASSIFEVGDRLGYIGSGYSPVDKTIKERLVTFDNNLNNFKYETLAFGAQQPVSGINKYIEVGSTLWGTGYASLANQGSDPSTIRNLPIDKNTGATGAPIDFKMPAYSTIVSGERPDNWFVNILDIIPMKNGNYVAYVQYSNWDYSHSQYVFINFDANGNVISKFGEKGKISTNVFLQKKISNDRYIYYFDKEYSSTNAGLIKYDTISNEITVVNQNFPKNTSMYIEKENTSSSNYMFYGYASSIKDSFLGYGDAPGAVTGMMDEKFSLINAQIIRSDAPLNINYFTGMSGNKINIAGTTFEGNQTTSSFVSEPSSGWAVKDRGLGITNAMDGVMEKITDYPPGIKFLNTPPLINIDDKTLDINKELLDGVSVTDVFDLDTALGNRTQAWLNARINQNPLDPKINYPEDLDRMPIDWSALGFDKTNYGPQMVKYFVTDSSLQATSTSRLINNVDAESVFNEKGALAAENFSLAIGDTASLNMLTAKSTSNLKAWDLMTGDVKDDGTSAKNIVTVDEAQLKEIQDAKAKYADLSVGADKSTVIKPYDLKFTFKYGASDLVRTIKVFVTDDNTVVDKTNNVVLYGFDFAIPLHTAKSITSAQVVANSKATAWDLKTSSQLPTEKITSDVVNTLNKVPATPPGPGTNLINLMYDGKTKMDVVATLTVSKVKMTVKHQDENGKPLVDETGKMIEDVVTLVDVAGPYTSNQVTVTGYAFTSVSENSTGTVPEADFIVTYIYKGSLSFVSVPAVMEFETGKVFALDQTIQRKLPDWEMTIRDTRGTKTIWTVQASLTTPLKNATGKTLPNALRYIKEDGTEVILGPTATTMYQNANSSNATPVVTPVKWSNGKGLVIKTKAGEVVRGAYEAEIKWVLVDGP